MKVLIVSQYFWPENFRINDLAAGLVERGHEVTVLTGIPNYPDGKFYSGYSLFRNRRENYKGVTVLRVPLIPRGNGGGLRLILNYISFAISASIIGPICCKGKYDLIFVFQMSPVTMGIPAIVLKKLYKIPIFFWVQDLWPESLAATGSIKSKFILSAVGKVVTFIYRRCDWILIQSRTFFDSIVHQGGEADRILYFPNSAEKIFSTGPSPLENMPILPKGFKIMFAGNIGAAQDFETIISAAEGLKSYKDIQWIIIGDGRMRGWAEIEVKNRGLSNSVHFLGRYPLETMPTFFAQSDALLVTLKKEPIFSLTIPSKIQSYLACGKPIIAAIDGEGANIIEEASAGYTCPGGAPDALSQAVLKMYRVPKLEREKMGMNGRKYYESNFDRDVLMDKLELWMRKTAH